MPALSGTSRLSADLLFSYLVVVSEAYLCSCRQLVVNRDRGIEVGMESVCGSRRGVVEFGCVDDRRGTSPFVEEIEVDGSRRGVVSALEELHQDGKIGLHVEITRLVLHCVIKALPCDMAIHVCYEKQQRSSCCFTSELYVPIASEQSQRTSSFFHA